MMKLTVLISGLVLTGVIVAGCVCCKSVECSSKSNDCAFRDARRKIIAGKAGCVIIKNGKIIHDENGRGISPILDIFRQHPDKMKDSVLVDKVIGKAAAMVAICGKVKQVHAELICDSAVEILKKHAVAVSWTKRVKNILNRRRDGLCPMEMTVLEISDPAAGVSALEAAVAKMKAAQKQ